MSNCKWEQDEVCVNADCPLCADFCPVTQHPEICKFAEFEGQKRTQGDKIRAMTDEELATLLVQSPCPPNRHGAEYGRSYTECPTDETIKTCKECWAAWRKQEVGE